MAGGFFFVLKSYVYSYDVKTDREGFSSPKGIYYNKKIYHSRQICLYKFYDPILIL